MKEPKWATTLKNQISKDFNKKPPKIYWQKRGLFMKRWDGGDDFGKYSGGLCASSDFSKGYRMVVLHGCDPTDLFHVFLHEMAHFLEPPASEGHDIAFYRILWRLVRKYKADMLISKEREFEYNPEEARKSYYTYLKFLKKNNENML